MLGKNKHYYLFEEMTKYNLIKISFIIQNITILISFIKK